MKHRYIPGQLFLAGLLASQLGCADGGESLQILQNQAPEEGCVLPANRGAQFLARGRIDVAASGGYLFTPLVENQAVASQAARRTAFVEGANVDLSFPKGFFSNEELSTFKEQGLTYFRQPFSGSIVAGGTATFGFEVIPKAMLDNLAGKLGPDERVPVTASVQIVGSMDGSDLTSSTFHYPIEVCNGCLLNNLGSCDTSGDAVNLGGACQPLQDGVVDCCTDGGGNLVCPAVSTSAE